MLQNARVTAFTISELLTLSRPGFLSLKLSEGGGGGGGLRGVNLILPPRISGTKNQLPLKLCRILDQCITKIFLPKWLMMTSYF